MAFTVQSISPTIAFFSYKDNSCYYIFEDSSSNLSGKNLQSYSYQKSMDNFSGSFQISVKESVENYTEYESFLNQVKNLDVVKIYEGENIDFIGVITNISYNAVSTGPQKVINISGRSIEYLFEYLNISLDATAMAWANSTINTSIANICQKLTVMENGEPTGKARVKIGLKSIYDEFINVAKNNSRISNITICNLIDNYYGSDIFEIDDNLKFKYPISSNLFTNGTCNYITYIRNLLPSNVYEIYGAIINNQPKIVIREVPFSKEDWIKLKASRIDSDFLTQYTVTRSIEEVYTAFYSYIEGSPVSPEFQENLNAIQLGKNAASAPAKLLEDKIKLYGYKPLKCNFIGFRTEAANKIQENFISEIGELNNKIAEWYGELDTMLDSTISVVRSNENTDSIGNIGEKLIFLNGEFYIAGIEHSWRYGDSVKITYHCERGGKYNSDGKYSVLDNISHPLGEFR